MYLPEKASRARVREAENARRNRAEILKAWSQGQVSRRDLIKMGLFTTAAASLVGAVAILSVGLAAAGGPWRRFR